MNKREAGAFGEQRAAAYLENRGMKIAVRNFRCRQGEIDLIGYHDGCLVFVEVKYRKTDKRGSALEAVNAAKQRRICRTADFYRYMHGIDAFTSMRYDVVALQGEEIYWIQNAFEHVYTR